MTSPLGLWGMVELLEGSQGDPHAIGYQCCGVVDSFTRIGSGLTRKMLECPHLLLPLLRSLVHFCTGAKVKDPSKDQRRAKRAGGYC